MITEFARMKYKIRQKQLSGQRSAESSALTLPDNEYKISPTLSPRSPIPPFGPADPLGPCQ